MDGSFVTAKIVAERLRCLLGYERVSIPSNWTTYFSISAIGGAAQKARFQGEFFPADLMEGLSGKTFLEFFQVDKQTGDSKGIVCVRL